MRLIFSKKIYPQEALTKACYILGSRMLFDIEHDNENYYVDLIPINNDACNFKELESEFRSELLLQAVRYVVSQKTRTLRELILARAFASTMVGEPQSDYSTKDNIDADVVDVDEILENWFKSKEFCADDGN